jgi:hypothetical protein
MEMGDTGCFLHSFGGKGAHAICLTKGKKNLGATFGFLSDMITKFYKGRPGDQGQFEYVSGTTGANKSDGLRTMMNKWNGPNIMKTEKVKSQIQDTLDNVGDAIEALTIRGENLTELMDKAEDMAVAAMEVQKAGEGVYWAMWKRHMKWIIMIIIAILVLIIIIVIGICAAGGCSS